MAVWIGRVLYCQPDLEFIDIFSQRKFTLSFAKKFKSQIAGVPCEPVGRIRCRNKRTGTSRMLQPIDVGPCERIIRRQSDC